MTADFARVQRAGPTKTRHFIGGELAARASVVYLDHNPDGVYLYRYSDTGEFVGDTWHASLDDARHQAEFEFGADHGPWLPVPSSAVDLGQFSVALCADDSAG